MSATTTSTDSALRRGLHAARRISLWAALAAFTIATTLTAGAPSARADRPAATAPAKPAPAKPAARPARPSAKAAVTGKLNLNTATVEQLTMLPGVGPAKAELVLAWRQKYGTFKRVKDLRRVKGFGYKTVSRLEPYLATSGSTTLAHPATAPK